MSSSHLLGVSIAEAVINSIKPGILSEESIHMLGHIFPDTLILAALDLTDRENVIKYTTPWGRTQYEVLGSTASYSVFPNLGPPGSFSPMSAYCTCPTFAYTVLSDTHVMCKHVLAVRLAQQLALCVERPVTEDELAAVVTRQCA